MIKIYTLLGVAILAEVIGTNALKASDNFTRPLITVVSLVCYGLSLWLLSVVMKTLPVGLVYAIWAGLGIVLIAITGKIVFNQSLDAAALVGIGFIVAGVLILNLFSGTIPE